MDISTKPIQEKIFQIAKEKLGDKDKLLIWVQENFRLSQSSAYRRISGETDLTFRELMFTISSISISL